VRYENRKEFIFKITDEIKTYLIKQKTYPYPLQYDEKLFVELNNFLMAN
jgi:hypothetical protein